MRHSVKDGGSAHSVGTSVLNTRCFKGFLFLNQPGLSIRLLDVDLKGLGLWWSDVRETIPLRLCQLRSRTRISIAIPTSR